MKNMPTELYRVTSEGANRFYRDSLGGKTFRLLKEAKTRRDNIIKAGGTSQIYVCYPEWELLEEE